MDTSSCKVIVDRPHSLFSPGALPVRLFVEMIRVVEQYVVSVYWGAFIGRARSHIEISLMLYLESFS